MVGQRCRPPPAAPAKAPCFVAAGTAESGCYHHHFHSRGQAFSEASINACSASTSLHTVSGDAFLRRAQRRCASARFSRPLSVMPTRRLRPSMPLPASASRGNQRVEGAREWDASTFIARADHRGAAGQLEHVGQQRYCVVFKRSCDFGIVVPATRRSNWRSFIGQPAA